MIEILFVTLVLAIIYVMYKYIVIIPPNKIAILEQLGRYSRVLESGVHILYPIVDSLHFFNWSYINQNNKLARLRAHMLYKNNVQIDIPPIPVTTKDGMPVTIDFTVFYSIVNVETACYKCQDPLNMFYQTVVENIRSQISITDSANVTGKDRALAAVIIESINKECEQDIGIKCSNLRIQSVQIPETLQKRNLELATYTREHNTQIEKLRLQHTLDKQKRELELEACNHALTLERYRYKMLQKEFDFTASDVIELMRVEKMPVNPQSVAYYLPAIKTTK